MKLICYLSNIIYYDKTFQKLSPLYVNGFQVLIKIVAVLIGIKISSVW